MRCAFPPYALCRDVDPARPSRRRVEIIRCHCEERSDEAISAIGRRPARDCFATLAMTVWIGRSQPICSIESQLRIDKLIVAIIYA